MERVNPAVVNIAVVDRARGNAHEDVPDAPALDLPRRGEGSGFLVDPEGYILTNHHLVGDAQRIRVRLADRSVPDEAYAAVRAHFSEDEVVFLSVAIAAINAWNRLGAAFRFAPPLPKRVAAAAS